MRQPLPPLGLLVAVALLAGVSLVQLAPALPPLWCSAGLLLAAGVAYSRPKGWRAAGAFVFGIAWACLVGQWVMQQRLATPGDFRVEGRVLGLPQREDESVRFDFLVQAGDAQAPIGRRIRLGWYGQAAPSIEPGSRWELQVRLKRPRGVLNPGGFDFERNALAQRIAATGYVRHPRSARALANGAGIDHWRDRVSAQIAGVLPEGRGRFVRALAIGDTRGLGHEDWETLRATGLTHQIAISGFHVGMVGGFGALLMLALYKLLPALGRALPAPQACALAAMGCAAMYTAVAGFALPTVRTWVMIAVVLAARMSRRAQAGGQSMALALVAILLFDPLSVLAPGFWLSFAGVGWLVWCLPGQRSGAWLRPFLEAQGVAALALLPLTVWFFGQASLPGPLANLLGVPVISLAVVPSALTGLLVAPFAPGAAAVCWRASAAIMDWLWSALQWLGTWPAATVWLPEPSLLALVLASVAAFWLLLPRATPGKSLAIVLFLPLLWPHGLQPAAGEATVEVIDVGQGLSVLVRTAGHGLLYDAGPASGRGLDLGEAAVVPTMRAAGLRRLDTVLISHGDNDHAGGLAAVRRAYPGARVLGAEGWAQPGMGLCQGRQAWRWDEVSFQVLHPPPLFPYMRNDSSCVLRIEAGGRVVLLPGDIGRHVEARLLHEWGTSLPAELILVPHHGSRTSSTMEFVTAVNASWAVVSAGHDNRFKLPREEVIARYRQDGARVVNTAHSGYLRFRLNAAGARLETARRQDIPRYWRDRLAPAQAMLSRIE